jgi:hypothetical protein
LIGELTYHCNRRSFDAVRSSGSRYIQEHKGFFNRHRVVVCKSFDGFALSVFGDNEKAGLGFFLLPRR